MNVIFVFLCNFLLFNDCLTAYTDGDSLHSEIRQRNNGESEIKMSPLNEDFLYPMFDESTLEQMLQFAKNPRISAFVQKHIFPVKYREYWFNLVGINDVNVVELFKSVNICGFNFFLEIIKHFGGSIKKLDIKRADIMIDERSEELCQYVNEYCSDSLTSFTMGTIKRNTLTQLTKPFSKLEDLKFFITTNLVESDRSINDIFPKLQRLIFGFYSYEFDDDFNDNSFIDCTIPHMKHLEIVLIVKNRSHLTTVHKQLKNMLRKNPQIQSLSYGHSIGHAGDFIQVINECLPKMENFTINDLDPEMQPVHLENVKYFTVRGDAAGPFERLSFSSLESLNMLYSANLEIGSARNSWITFFKNHQNIKAFHCTVLRSNVGLVELLDELPSLNEIGILSYGNYDFNIISRLIENHEHLLKLEYRVNAIYHLNKAGLTIYLEHFGNGWNITENADEAFSTLTFEKKI